MGKKKSDGAAAAEMVVTRVLEIPVGQIVEASENTRRSSWGDLGELAASIEEQGQITPGLVRLVGPGRFELVVGARRFRAVQLAGRSVFRAEVRELDDESAHETRMVENNQREDVGPMEEAEAFRISRAVHGRTVDEIAARLGRSPAYVYQRLRLLELATEVRELVATGRLGVDGALLLAQFEQPVQRGMIRSISWGGRDRRIAKGDVARAIEGSSRKLGGAPFAPADAELVPTVGACTSCPKRTGLQGTLFGVTEEDRCLDTKCFDVKSTALAKRKLADAKSVGLQVLEGDEAKKVVNPHGGLRYDAGYVDLDDTAHFLTKSGEITDIEEEEEERDDGEIEHVSTKPVTWRDVLGPDFRPVVAVAGAAVVELAPSDIAHQALATVDPQRGKQAKREDAATTKFYEDQAEREQRAKDDARKAKEKADAEREGDRRAMAALVQSVETPGDSVEDRADLLRAFVVAMMQGTWADTLNEVCSRRGWKLEDPQVKGKKLSAAEVITREMSDFDPAQVSALAVEIVATRTKVAAYPAKVSGFESLLAVRNIDLGHHRREAAKLAKEKRKEKAAKAKKKTRAAEFEDAAAE